MSGIHKNPTKEELAAALLAGAITKEEIARKRRSVQIGDMIILRQQTMSGEKPGAMNYIKERCTVIAKYPALVIFQRPPARSGQKRTCSRLWVELCMADRGQVI